MAVPQTRVEFARTAVSDWQEEVSMARLTKLAGAYMIVLAVVVAVYFIINTVLGESIDDFDVRSVWNVLDVLMLIGLVLALVFNYIRKREEDRSGSGGAVTRQYLEVNLAFYLTAGVTVLFLHNWLSLLALGGDSLDGNHQAWIIWAFVDVMLPLTLGTTGCRLLCGESGS